MYGTWNISTDGNSEIQAILSIDNKWFWKKTKHLPYLTLVIIKLIL